MMKPVAMLLLMTTGGCAPRAVEVPPELAGAARYQFKAGDVLTYRTRFDTQVDLSGSHSDFLIDGEVRPFVWSLDGDYENVILDVKGGTAEMERRVARVESKGSFHGKRFGLTWKMGDPPPQAHEVMDPFIVSTIKDPTRFSVTSGGDVQTQTPDRRRLILNHGMAYWPMSVDESTWTCVEVMAIPAYYVFVEIEFRSAVQQDVIRPGCRARVVKASAHLKEARACDLQYKLAGSARAVFDLTHGRLLELDIDLKIDFDGTATASDGSVGTLRGVVSYRGSQALVQ